MTSTTFKSCHKLEYGELCVFTGFQASWSAILLLKQREGGYVLNFSVYFIQKLQRFV